MRVNFHYVTITAPHSVEQTIERIYMAICSSSAQPLPLPPPRCWRVQADDFDTGRCCVFCTDAVHVDMEEICRNLYLKPHPQIECFWLFELDDVPEHLYGPHSRVHPSKNHRTHLKDWYEIRNVL